MHRHKGLLGPVNTLGGPRSQDHASAHNLRSRDQNLRSANQESSSKRRRTDAEHRTLPWSNNDTIQDSENEDDVLSKPTPHLRTRSNRWSLDHVDLTGDAERSQRSEQVAQPSEYLQLEKLMNSDSYARSGHSRKAQAEELQDKPRSANSIYDGSQKLVHTQRLKLSQHSPEQTGPTKRASGDQLHPRSPPNARKLVGLLEDTGSSTSVRPAKDGETKKQKRKASETVVPLSYFVQNGNLISKQMSLVFDGTGLMRFNCDSNPQDHSIDLKSNPLIQASTMGTGTRIRVRTNGRDPGWCEMSIENEQDYHAIISEIRQHLKSVVFKDDTWMKNALDKSQREVQMKSQPEHTSMRSTFVSTDGDVSPYSERSGKGNRVAKMLDLASKSDKKLIYQLKPASLEWPKASLNENGAENAHPRQNGPMMTRRSARCKSASVASEVGEVCTSHQAEQAKASTLPKENQVDHGPAWKRPLVYPLNGKRRATVEFEDLQRLDEGEFLNDNLIWFYLRYLMVQIDEKRPDDAKKIYWFNSYFYEKLTGEPRPRQGINYYAVKRWTKDVDLFAYDYVVVPVNESAHWYIAIICNLPSLLKPSTSEGEGSPRPLGSSLMNPIGIDNSQQNQDKEDLIQPVVLLDDVASEDQEPATLQNCNSSDKNEADLLMVPSSPHDNTERLDRDADQHSYLFEEKHATDDQVLDQQSRKQLIQESRDVEERAQPRIQHPLPDHRRDAPVSKRKKRFSGRPFDPTTAAIITLDSLGLTHPQTTKYLKLYLIQEALEKKGLGHLQVPDIQGINAKGIPQQDNFCDCGLFLLGYMEQFIKDPTRFVTKLLRRESNADGDWPDLQPSHMRRSLKMTIIQLHHEHHHERRLQKRSDANAATTSDTRKPERHTQIESFPLSGEMASNKANVDGFSKNDNLLTGGLPLSPKGTPKSSQTRIQASTVTYGDAFDDSTIIADQSIVPDSQAYPQSVLHDTIRSDGDEAVETGLLPSQAPSPGSKTVDNPNSDDHKIIRTSLEPNPMSETGKFPVNNLEEGIRRYAEYERLDQLD